VTVTVNTPPVANAGADRTVAGSASVTLDGTGSSDANGGTLAYAWTQTAGPAVTLTGAATAQPTFTSPANPSTLTFELSVEDGEGETDTDTVTITVVDPPVLRVTTAHSCQRQGATLGLQLKPLGPTTTFELATSNSGLLPVSRMSVDATGLTVRPRSTRSGVASVTITARNAGGSTTLVVRVLVGTNGDDVLKGSAMSGIILARGGDDVANGKDARDLLCGGDGDDRLRGGFSADVLYGEGGNDRLRGGAGDDLLVGGPGQNQLTPRGLRLPAF
jgi:Ca2+-binding RTX toxin-like protein